MRNVADGTEEKTGTICLIVHIPVRIPGTEKAATAKIITRAGTAKATTVITLMYMRTKA